MLVTPVRRVVHRVITRHLLGLAGLKRTTAQVVADEQETARKDGRGPGDDDLQARHPAHLGDACACVMRYTSDGR